MNKYTPKSRNVKMALVFTLTMLALAVVLAFTELVEVRVVVFMLLISGVLALAEVR